MHELDEPAKTLRLPPHSLHALSPRFAEAHQKLQSNPLDASGLYASLEQLLKLFTGMAAGLARHLDPSRPEIAALASGLDRPLQYERLLRFSVNLLRHHLPDPSGVDALGSDCLPILLSVFFPGPEAEDVSAPLHTVWLQLGAEASPLPPLSRWPETPDEHLLRRYREVLDRWLIGAQQILPQIEWQVEASRRYPPREIRSWKACGHVIPLVPPCPYEAEPSGEGSAEWTPLWTRAEFDEIARQLDKQFAALPQLLAPAFLYEPARQELLRHASAYLLLEGPEGCGKSLAVAGLKHALAPELPLLHFPVRACCRGDFHTLIEELDEGIQARLDAQVSSMIPLGPLVIQELNRRYASLTPAEKFQAYLSQLILRNGQRFVLALDGLDEAFEGSETQVSLADFLPDHLPDGVFLLLAYRLEGCSARLHRRLTQLLERGAIPLSLPLNSPAYRRWAQENLEASMISPPLAAELVSAEYPLMLSRVLGQGFEAGWFSLNRWPGPEQIYDEVMDYLEQRWGEPLLRMLMVLATSYTPVPLEELSDLGFSARMLEELLAEMPALFLVQRPTANSGWQMQLAHESLRLHLQEHFSGRYSETCERLAERASQQVLHRLPSQSTDSDTLNVGSFRLDCLYRWLLDSQNLALTEKVVYLQPLRQFRNQVCGYLEQHNRHHHKLSILQGLKSCLELVLLQSDSTELRDELAWAYNSRGLTYLHLGQFSRCLEELEAAEQQFRVLVDHRNLVHYRSGLASALNRRSEALRALGQVGEAWECAHQSVEHHRQALVEGGPQQPRLGLARALVQRARCAAEHSLWPRVQADLKEALTLLEGSTRQAQSRGNSAEIAMHLNEWVRGLMVRAEAYRIQGENDNCLLDLDQALLLTQSLEELQGVDWSSTRAPEVQVLQARAYEALQGFEEALDCYDEAIAGYSQQVREGRLDLRQHLAEAYHARAELRRRRNRMDLAVEDYTRSLAFHAQLIECEEQSYLRPTRAQTYQGRGDCLGALARRREALQDYDKAIEDYLYGLNSGKLQQTDLRRLAQVYFASGQLHRDLGEASQAADRAASAIKLLEERLSGPAEAVAQAHLLQAEALHKLGDNSLGLESVTKAIQVLSLRARGGSGLERQLADAHRLRAEMAYKMGDRNQAFKDLGLAFHLYGGEGVEPERLQQAEVLRTRARLQSEQHEYDAALEDLSAALDLLSDSSQEAASEERLRLRRLRAHILAQQERVPQAISELLHALDEQRQNPSGVEHRLGLLLDLMGYQASSQQWGDFSVLYSEFLRLRESAPELADSIHGGVKRLFARIEAHPAVYAGDGLARADVLVALARLQNQLPAQPGEQRWTPGLVRALHTRGLERLRCDRVTEALEDLSEAIAQLRSRRDAEQPMLLAELYNLRADGLLRAGLQARAYRDLDEAAKLLSDYSQDLDALARLTILKTTLLRKDGQLTQVVHEVGSVLSLSSTRPLPAETLGWLHLGRALAYDGLEQPARALPDYREAAQLLAQVQEERADVLQERLRCRVRLVQLETADHQNFLQFCVEDAVRCLGRLRCLSPGLASQWLAPSLAQLAHGHIETGGRWLDDLLAELRHYQPGPLASSQCDQVALLLARISARVAQPAAAEQLLGLALRIAAAGNPPHRVPTVLELLGRLAPLYAHRVPSVQVEDSFLLLERALALQTPEGKLGVQWNHVIRTWLALPEEHLSAAGVSRPRLQSLRLW